MSAPSNPSRRIFLRGSLAAMLAAGAAPAIVTSKLFLPSFSDILRFGRRRGLDWPPEALILKRPPRKGDTFIIV
jgi:hypothetical protein